MSSPAHKGAGRPGGDSVSFFQKLVLDFYHSQGRDFLWRQDTRSYVIYLSEVMLQQTQTSRVSEMLPPFLAAFPDFEALARAPLGEVLRHWQGLGYNRRARWLWEGARHIVDAWGGELPRDPAMLRQIKGLGPNTAASILVYAYDQPLAFVETNIRTVYLHHFWPSHEEAVADRDILAMVARTLPPGSPRIWYWALMDYGVWLKKTVGNHGKKAKAYQKQTRFEGSRRQVRGRIIKVLGEGPALRAQELRERLPPAMGAHLDDLESILEALKAEGLVAERAGEYSLP